MALQNVTARLMNLWTFQAVRRPHIPMPPCAGQSQLPHLGRTGENSLEKLGNMMNNSWPNGS